jgi:hypothetical protein
MVKKEFRSRKNIMKADEFVVTADQVAAAEATGNSLGPVCTSGY